MVVIRSLDNVSLPGGLQQLVHLVPLRPKLGQREHCRASGSSSHDVLFQPKFGERELAERPAAAPILDVLGQREPVEQTTATHICRLHSFAVHLWIRAVCCLCCHLMVQIGMAPSQLTHLALESVEFDGSSLISVAVGAAQMVSLHAPVVVLISW